MTARLTDLYRGEIAGRIQPVLVEYKQNLLLPNLDIPVQTILDVYTANGELHDLKTSSHRWTPEKADESPQMTLYRESVRLACGSYPERMYFDVMLKYVKPRVRSLRPAEHRTTSHLSLLSSAACSATSGQDASCPTPWIPGCAAPVCAHTGAPASTRTAGNFILMAAGPAPHGNRAGRILPGGSPLRRSAAPPSTVVPGSPVRPPAQVTGPF